MFVMHTYMRAMNLGLPVDPDVWNHLYLDVDYQVRNSEVAIKSVRFYGDSSAPVLSEEARQKIAQEIQDSLVFGY